MHGALAQSAEKSIGYGQPRTVPTRSEYSIELPDARMKVRTPANKFSPVEISSGQTPSET